MSPTKPFHGLMPNVLHPTMIGCKAFWLFNERQGEVHDSFTGRYNGTLRNNVAWEYGKLKYTASSTGIQLDNDINTPSSGWAFSFRINLSARSDTWDMFAGESTSTTDFLGFNSGNYLRIRDGAGNGIDVTGVVPPKSVWAIYTVTVISGVGYVYRDGVLLNSVSGSHAGMCINNIGQGYSAASLSMAGLLDWVCYHENPIVNLHDELVKNPFAAWGVDETYYGDYISGAAPTGNPWYYYAQQQAMTS